jgi:HAD superfamily hydrolase (TIGR01509 family)
MQKGIKNILFDLGGVLLNLDYALTVSAFRKYSPGFKSFDAVYSGHSNRKVFEDFETGLISAVDFRNEVRVLLGRELSDAAIDEAWNAMLLDFPARRVDLLKRVGKEKRIFLLSNTNEIHLKALEGKLPDVFEKVYFSNRVGMRKPNADIFRYVLEENDLDAAQTLFIDDSPHHVEGAGKLGIQTYLLKKGVEVADLFSGV